MNEQQSWFALEITVASEASEAIEFGLNELAALGTEINNLRDKPTETVCVIGYFSELPGEELIQTQLNEALRIYGFAPPAIRQTRSRKIGNVDWLFEWKKHWKPTETEKFIIAPTWEDVENSGKIVVSIEPNMAFGTGTHETTQLCLKAIEDTFQSDMSFLDVGTGTGILAIAAAKLARKDSGSKPSSRFEACDTDATSIKIAIENAELNETADINFFVGSISGATPPFDFVCANLTIDVILPILPLLLEKTKQYLVLSGILKEQESLITEKLEELDISNFKIETRGEWISVLIAR